MSDAAKKRTVKPDGRAIQRLRIEKGWRVEDLARKAICSSKTVVSAERGENVYLFTLRKIATALGVDCMTLLEGETPEPIKERTWEITLKIKTPHDEFDEANDLIKLMAVLIKRLGGEDRMEPESVTSGSTSVTLNVTGEQLMRVLRAYIDGELDDLNIESVMAPIVLTLKKASVSGDKKYWKRKYSRLLRKMRQHLDLIRKKNLSGEL